MDNQSSTTPALFLGKYQLIAQLGRGGMADVYVCRLKGIGGFEKEVVVKRILPERAGDPYFVRMFLDEARMVANLTHPNIVQVFEIGEQDGVPFMAMEYVRGVPLGMIIRECRRKQRVHYLHAATLVAGIYDALDYAHNAHGPDGHALGLVHRDVTPSNIMVSASGTPKLLDFGVALSRDRLAKTEAGTIKGKLRYMAPEQLSQGPLDHRADVFSLGVCLYELTTGQHPFGPHNGSEVAALRNIINGVISKPTDLVPSFPPALEEIVLSAIEMDVNTRCPSASELRHRLDAFMAASGGPLPTRELVSWMRALLPNLDHLTKTGTYPAPTLGQRSGAAPSTGSASASVPESNRTTEPVSNPLPLESEATSVSSTGRWKRVAGAAALVLAIAGAVSALTLVSGRPPKAASEHQTAQLSTPRAAIISAEDAASAYLETAEKQIAEKRLGAAQDTIARAKEMKIGRWDFNIRLSRISESLATAQLVEQAAEQSKEGNWREAVNTARMVLEREPENQTALRIVAAAQPTPDPAPTDSSSRRDAYISVTTTPPANVYVDGRFIGHSPILKHSIGSGHHTISARAPGYRATETEVTVKPREKVSLGLSLAAD